MRVNNCKNSISCSSRKIFYLRKLGITPRIRSEYPGIHQASQKSPHLLNEIKRVIPRLIPNVSGGVFDSESVVQFRKRKGLEGTSFFVFIRNTKDYKRGKFFLQFGKSWSILVTLFMRRLCIFANDNVFFCPHTGVCKS